MEEKKGYKGNLVVLGPKELPKSSFRQITVIRNRRDVKDATGHAAIFLLKVAALETIRKVSKANCPFYGAVYRLCKLYAICPLNLFRNGLPLRVWLKECIVCSLTTL